MLLISAQFFNFSANTKNRIADFLKNEFVCVFAANAITSNRRSTYSAADGGRAGESSTSSNLSVTRL